ncbi:adventurous gliding motility protein CglE [Myxococcus landrumensis]|uniref:Adventurous gliding motility protein CglE n=1 Tax=Myxococcus landrumensis TaxID=2813577 RepID=A0ABX7NG03_9BACT|nr:adventurous gliding motility protein CglE [Myxococcus landrumus]QSQ15248.1 adventurous gliding motility protein CglE [Myxococcus landrumus]
MNKSQLVAALAFALLSSQALAGTPPEGVEFKPRRGFYTDTNVGVFFTVGGQNSYSNAQTYLQLGIGYDLTERISLGAHFGMGASAQNCFAGYLPGSETCALSDNFTMQFLNATASYHLRLMDRVYLTPKLVAGYTRLDPAPVDPDKGDPGRAVSAPNAGVGVGFEYSTGMDHFSVGADVLARFVIGPDITSFAIFPKVKYTF